MLCGADASTVQRMHVERRNTSCHQHIMQCQTPKATKVLKRMQTVCVTSKKYDQARSRDNRHATLQPHGASYTAVLRSISTSRTCKSTSSLQLCAPGAALLTHMLSKTSNPCPPFPENSHTGANGALAMRPFISANRLCWWYLQHTPTARQQC